MKELKGNINTQSVEKCRNNRLATKQEYLRRNPCERCGESDWRCLDLHHLPGTKKHRALVIRHAKTGRLRGGSWRDVPFRDMVEEFAKCNVLCANCHRKEHRDG